MITRYILGDTETTGTKEGAKACEIGWIELDEQAQWTTQVDSLLDPEIPISYGAMGIHDITNEMVAGSPTIEEFFSVDDPSCYGKRIQADRVVLIGHRVSFDRRFIEPFIDGEIQELCTLRWIRNLYPDMDDHKLSTAKYALGLRKNAGDAHRVMADVWVTYDLLLHLLAKTGTTLAELTERSQAPMLIHTMPMGKHKGQPMSEVPRSYLDWALRNMQDLDQDQRFTFEHFYNNR